MVNIYQILQNITDLELPTIKLKHLELSVNIDPSVPEIIKTDSTKLHRILLNLLGNSIKFTDKGRITIDISCRDLDKRKKQLIFAVTDTGTGIAKKDQDKVFDRFYRSNPAYKGQYSGFGVGLHIVQQYVDLLKGNISLKSKLGKGTTFTVSIPVSFTRNQKKISSKKKSIQIYNFTTAEKTASTAEPVAVVSQLPSNSSFLLLVEDNAIALKVAESTVKKAGCQYLSATTAEQAFELFKTHSFDLILSDIGLPGMSGNDLATAIRKLEKGSGKKPVPIVGLTAHAATAAKDESLAAGMNKVISKPINLSILEEILNNFVVSNQRQSTDTNSALGKDLPEIESELFDLAKYPLLDIEEGIKALGSEAALKDMIPLFADQGISNEELSNFHIAFSNRDWETISAIAHKLKGACLYCGATRMRYACQYLERYYKAGNNALLEQLCKQFLTVLDQTKEHLAKWSQHSQ